MIKTSLNIRDLVEAVELLSYAEKKGAFSDLSIIANKSQEIREKFTSIINEFAAMQQQPPQEMKRETRETNQKSVAENFSEEHVEENMEKVGNSSKKRKVK